MLGGRVSEVLGQLLIECNQLGIVESQKVVSSLRIIFELFPINVNVVLLRVPDEMHELVLNLMHLVLLAVALQVIAYQVLVRVEDLLSIEVVHFVLDSLSLRIGFG